MSKASVNHEGAALVSGMRRMAKRKMAKVKVSTVGFRTEPGISSRVQGGLTITRLLLGDKADDR